ncbi:MAG: preprotein translocase subunit SecE [Pseudomonadota bacterium]|nr:preprotein translocase subunit SecE [Pseudomonadota bacterium]
MPIGKALQFAKEVRAEGRRVTWPDMKSTRMMTFFVSVIVVMVAVYLYFIDVLLSFGIGKILGV